MLIIKKYRKVRERWEQYDTAPETGGTQELDTRQYAYVADKMKVSPERVQRTITFFMLEAPLKLYEMPQQPACHAKPERILVIQCPIQVKNDCLILGYLLFPHTNLIHGLHHPSAYFLVGIKNAVSHISITGISTTVSTAKSTTRIPTSIISFFSLKSFSGFCAAESGLYAMYR